MATLESLAQETLFLTKRVISLETELKKAVELSELRDKTLEARIIILEQSRQAHEKN